MVGPLVATKLHVPAPRGSAIQRSRLIERLDAGARSRLTLVAAPAGFGKTTLMTEWAAARRGTSGELSLAWVSLDDRDNEPATFWAYVVTSLQTASGGGPDGSPLGAAALTIISSTPAATDAALATLVNDLDAVDVELVLVLDDYHVIERQEIHDGMAYLLDHLPGNVHLVIATRSDPPLPLSRMRARGELVEVRSADLRFTEDEAAGYLADSMDLTLSDADVATLADRTEGWAAALQLAALSLQGRDDPGAVVAKFAGDDRFIVDYLVDEVLDRLPADVRTFLLDTCILDRLTGPLCDAVTERTDGASVLRELERANLFLVPLDDSRQWYRYHQLFADVLRSHLGREDPDRVAAVHRRAADWLWANGDSPGAIKHALAAQDFDRAAELMELALPTMQRERAEAELARWVQALPDEVVRVRPVLAVGLIGALAQVSQFDEVGPRLAEIERQLCPDGQWAEHPPPGLIVVDEAGYRSVPASVAIYRAALALVEGRLQDTLDLSREALALVPPEDDMVRAAAGALAGLASWAMGDLETAYAAYTESAAGLERAGHLADVLGVSIALGDLCRTQGRLGDALRTYEEALDATAHSGGSPLRGTADMHTGIAGVLLERDDPEGAMDQLARVHELGEYNGLPQNAYRWRVVAAGLKEAEGDLDAALDLLDEADRLYNGDYSPNVRPVPAMRARLRIRRGELDQAEAWAKAQGLASDDALTYLREYEHATLARVLIARHADDGDPQALADAVSLLERLEAATTAGGRTGTLIEVLILLALARQAAGDSEPARDALRRALELGQPEGYVRIFTDEGEPMAALLKSVAKADADRATAAYARRLLTTTTGTPQPASVQQSGLIEPLSERELDVLRLLASDLDGPDIARALHVSLNTLRTHTRNIFRKLQVNNRRAAVRQAAELDLLP